MLPDPRLFASFDLHADSLLTLARESIACEIPAQQEKLDVALRAELKQLLEAGGGARLANAIANAPSVDVARHVWRRLAEAFGESGQAEITTRVFALPVVIVAGAAESLTIPGVLSDVAALTDILQAHGALAGNRNFSLANALVSAPGLGFERAPELFRWQSLSDSDGAAAPKPLEPAPIVVTAAQETVHLRFLVGAAVAPARVDLFGASGTVGKWAMPFAQALAKQLAQPGLTLLALPRAPASPPIALDAGRRAQREVSLQLYASNAIRKFRASVGEPSAVISAHRAPDAPGGGELRVSLSSPFDPEKRSAEGFRCPLGMLDRVADVERAVVSLLQDCRLTDIHVLPQLFPDRDPLTTQRLFIRPEILDESAALALQ
jgi:hypothetical protein